jgi:flagella basal body P-ring formation protein FlgA
MMFFVPFAMAGCLTLAAGSDRITAADLAPAFAGLESVPRETVLSFAPAPGVERVFRIPELRRIAAQFHLTPPENEICIARIVLPLDSATLLAAMQKEMPGAKIAVLEFSRGFAPQGEITFRRSGLRSTSVAGAMWYGAVRYAANRDFTIWAKVTVTTQVSRVIAKRGVAAGALIEPEDVAVEMRDEFPSVPSVPLSAGEVAGKSSRVPVPAGGFFRREMLDSAKDVRQGDIVEVDVQNGGAHLKFEARAEASGAAGEIIPVRNPISSKRFLAKVEGKGRVFVDGSTAKVNP